MFSEVTKVDRPDIAYICRCSNMDLLYNISTNLNQSHTLYATLRHF